MPQKDTCPLRKKAHQGLGGSPIIKHLPDFVQSSRLHPQHQEMNKHCAVIQSPYALMDFALYFCSNNILTWKKTHSQGSDRQNVKIASICAWILCSHKLCAHTAHVRAHTHLSIHRELWRSHVYCSEGPFTYTGVS